MGHPVPGVILTSRWLQGGGDPYGKAEALFTGTDRGCGGGGMRGGIISGLREGGGYLSWQKRQDSLRELRRTFTQRRLRDLHDQRLREWQDPTHQQQHRRPRSFLLARRQEDSLCGPRRTQGRLRDLHHQRPRGDKFQLTHNDVDEEWPTYSPNGKRIAYTPIEGVGGIYSVKAGGGDKTLVAHDGGAPSYSPDGERIAYECYGRTPGSTPTSARSACAQSISSPSSSPRSPSGTRSTMCCTTRSTLPTTIRTTSTPTTRPTATGSSMRASKEALSKSKT